MEMAALAAVTGLMPLAASGESLEEEIQRLVAEANKEMEAAAAEERGEVKPDVAAAEEGGEVKPDVAAAEEGGEVKPETAEDAPAAEPGDVDVSVDPVMEALLGADSATASGADAGADVAADSTAGSDAEGKDSPAVAALSVSDRLLSRPGVALHAQPTDDSKSTTYLPSYSILTVVGEQDGWYQVAYREDADPVGWLKAEEIIPWKHQLVLQFAAPLGRERALFFASREEAIKVASMEAAERSQYLDAVRKAIAENKEVEGGQVIACEPDGWAEMKNNFYLLPVVDFDTEMIPMGEEQAQIIRVSAATENMSNAADLSNTTGMTADVIFVMDLSRSMAPIKDDVLKAIRTIAQAIEKNPELKPGMVQFGFWGYRDNMEACPGIEFVTKNFTPDGTLPAGDFVKCLEQVNVTRVDSVDYAEDVLAGVNDAIVNTKWREGAARTIVLIGDAPGREPGKSDPFSRRRNPIVGTAAEKGVSQIAALADESQVSVATVYLNVRNYAEHLPIAREQFEGLASKTQNVAATVIDVSKPGDFTKFANDSVAMFVAQVKQASEGKSEIKGVTEGHAFASALFENARVRWLGSRHSIGVTPEMSGWIVDRDLNDPLIPPFEPCVLLTRGQLDNLQSLLTDVVAAGEDARLTSTGFLQSLQKVVVASAKDPALLKDARRLGDSRFVPSFLKDLPYQSDIMKLDDELWSAMGSDGQDQIIQAAKNKIKFYQEIYANSEYWMTPDANSEDSPAVTPIPLNQLP